MKEYYVWAQNNPDSAYLSSDTDAKEYIISRTSFISDVPQKHFDKFISDIIVLIDNDILIDFMGKSNWGTDFISGVMLGLSVGEMLAGIYVIGRSLVE